MRLKLKLELGTKGSCLKSCEELSGLVCREVVGWDGMASIASESA